MSKPLCFVLMPFGVKMDGNKKEIDFDKVYESFIKPSVTKAGLDPIRADEEKSGGFIHKPMYERLLFCSFSVADLSFANANVFYELGIRHAVRPYTTVSIFEKNTKLPFDVAPLRAMEYEFKDGQVENTGDKINKLAELIKANLNVQKTINDSPIAQLITSYKFPTLDDLQRDADAFTGWVNKIQAIKNELKDLETKWIKSDSDEKKAGKDKNDADKERAIQEKKDILDRIKKIESEAEGGLAYNYELLNALLEAYKKTGSFSEVIQMLKPLVNTTAGNVFLQQQLALAYNKVEMRQEAEEILLAVIEQYGPDPETNGLLGAVYKGLMDDYKDDKLLAREYHTKAVEVYLAGFESDPRNYYPGVNALTLMYFGERPDNRFPKFFPLVSYAVERLINVKRKDYWVQATALELAALELNEESVNKHLASSLFCNPADWMKKTTAGNLNRIYDKAVQSVKAEDVKWLKEAIRRLS